MAIFEITCKEDWYALSLVKKFEKNDQIILKNNIVFDNKPDPILIDESNTFDGSNNCISYLPGISTANLFKITGGIIKNLIVDANKTILQQDNGYIITSKKIGTNWGTIENVHVKNAYILFEGSGGLIGGCKFGIKTFNSLIMRSSVTESILGENCGGLGFFASYCNFEYSFFEGKFLEQKVAGICLKNLNNVIKYCYTNADIIQDNTASITYNNKNVKIQECFSTSKTPKTCIACNVNGGYLKLENCYVHSGSLIVNKNKNSNVDEKGCIILDKGLTEKLDFNIWTFIEKKPFLKEFLYNQVWNENLETPKLKPNNIGIWGKGFFKTFDNRILNFSKQKTINILTTKNNLKIDVTMNDYLETLIVEYNNSTMIIDMKTLSLKSNSSDNDNKVIKVSKIFRSKIGLFIGNSFLNSNKCIERIITVKYNKSPLFIRLVKDRTNKIIKNSINIGFKFKPDNCTGLLFDKVIYDDKINIA